MTHVHPPIPQHHINRYDIQALVHTKSPVSTTAKYTKAMRAQVNEPTSVAEDTSMQPPASRPQPSEKTTGQPYTKRRESRFDPIGQDSDDDEGYGELGHRHPLRQVKEDEPKSGSSFSLPGIKSLLNPSFGKCTSFFRLANAPYLTRQNGTLLRRLRNTVNHRPYHLLYPPTRQAGHLRLYAHRDTLHSHPVHRLAQNHKDGGHQNSRGTGLTPQRYTLDTSLHRFTSTSRTPSVGGRINHARLKTRTNRLG